MRNIKRNVFRSESEEKILRKDGYTIIDLLSEDQFAAFRSLVHQAHDQGDFDHVFVPTPFRLSAFNKDPEYKRNIYDTIYGFLKPIIEERFEDYVPLMVNVFQKLPSEGDDSVQIHQNPSFIDEPDAMSISIWIPLIDIEKKHGTLGVLPGSHHAFPEMRANNMPHIFAPVEDLLVDRYFKPMEFETGNATVLYDGLVHWSYPNRSNEIRTTVQLICTPKESKQKYFYYNSQTEQSSMDVYSVDKEFFFQNSSKSDPVGLDFIESHPFDYENISSAVFYNRCSHFNEQVKLDNQQGKSTEDSKTVDLEPKVKKKSFFTRLFG